MATKTITTYDGDGNVVEESVIEVPESDQERAEREFRAAVAAATTLAELKAALLGSIGPGAEPRSR